ncbi:hypothetical protein MMC30_005528 [Trapelia coarctata]|nr:hypothetical protein [Trapelia coarctata]
MRAAFALGTRSLNFVLVRVFLLFLPVLLFLSVLRSRVLYLPQPVISTEFDATTAESVEKAVEAGATISPRQFHLGGVGIENFDGIEGDVRYLNSDKRDMGRMGKLQELEDATTQGLVEGGLAGLFWSYIWTFLGLGLVVISLASMAPTAGGQYHWVSEFSPPRHQKWLSYFIGGLSMLSWQAGHASGPFLVGTIIQGILTVNDPTYNAMNWQGTLFVFGVVLLIFIFNVWGADAMPMINNALFLVLFCGFLAIVIVLWTQSPRNTSEAVFTQFTNEGGSDAAAHISEEVKDANITVPRTVFWSYALNGLMGTVMLIAYLYCITDLGGALNDPSGYPILWVFQNSLSLGVVNGLSVILVVIVFAGTISFNISTSRQTWSSLVITACHLAVGSRMWTRSGSCQLTRSF